ncbi:unnamed protein product [Urochloa decumbens]|uniref:KIB1-4 beta-propeller domain-containing protein n=1 Tax=Urochloa decumbens TaxID=240449 RepID=A0ABC8YZM8_9POAL
MGEGSSNSTQTSPMAGAVGEIMDSMRGLELSRQPQQQVGDVNEVGEPNAQESFPASDWSQLQQDLLVSIFSRLEFPDLVHSGAVCMPWYLSYSAVRRFRLCSPNQGPYIVYSSGDREINTATLHNLCTNKMYHVTLPDPPFITRHVIGSSHGWLVTADEQSNLHLLNPITGAQIALPPAESIEGVRPTFTADGILSGYRIGFLALESKSVLSNHKFFDSKETRCTSTIRIGEARWTWINTMECCCYYHDIFFNDDNALFYAIRGSGEIHTIDLSGQSPVVKVALNVLPEITGYSRYILRAPWGDLLQVLREYGPGPQDIQTDDEYQLNNEEQMLEEVSSDEQLGVDIEDPVDDFEVHVPVDRVTVHMVDLAKQKLTEIKNLRDHTIFIGFNRSFMLHARDFPSINPNCVYVTDDNKKYIHAHPFNGRRFGYLNLKDASLTELSFSDALLHWPPPVWFRPHIT